MVSKASIIQSGKPTGEETIDQRREGAIVVHDEVERIIKRR
jgi:hypothetical protein